MPETYKVCVQKETMVFSAAHFITFGDDICESLHGHNYGVKVEVEAALNHQGYVVDFIALRDEMNRLSGTLDHKVILPDRHPLIRVQLQEPEIIVTFRERRWIFPADNCVILPVANTTAELVAAYFGDQLQTWLEEKLGVSANRILVGVDENHGQWGIWEWNRR